jgi:exopolysaccharide biosynthesis polyprenyl glycosylphosphotransferase
MLRGDRQVRTQIEQIVDAGLFSLALWLAHVLRSNLTWGIFGQLTIEAFSHFILLYVLIIPGVPLVLESQGFYRRVPLGQRRVATWTLFKSCVFVTIAVILMMFPFKWALSRSVIVLFGVISFCLMWIKEELMRLAYLSKFAQLQMKKRVILVGTKEDTQRLGQDLQAKSGGNVEVVGELDLNEGTVEQLVQLMHEHAANGVLISARHIYFGQVERTIQACELEGVETWLVADFLQTQISRTSFDDFHGTPVMVFRSTPEASWQSVIKQVMDVVGAALLLVLTLPLFLMVALFIKLSSPGPVLFRQKRCGLNGRPFTMLKFRSMVSDAEQRKVELALLNEMEGPVFKVTHDPRITPIGRFIRRFSIDELPQLINVLRGEMSLVGPRPLPVDEVKRFDDFAHRRRLSVKPGLTCLWQVSGRNEVRSFKDWVRLDLEYIDNWSLWLDLKILLWTIPAVLTGAGAK